MIAFIRGELITITAEHVIVDVGGVGYGIFMPATAIGALPEIGSEVKIYTYLSVKEDSMKLFGFLSQESLRLFKMIINVSGIGPKGGLSILSTLHTDELQMAILSGDAKSIAASPGIGKKTAEKLILELRDKLKPEDLIYSDEDNITKVQIAGDDDIKNDAIAALVALGYSGTDSFRAVKNVNMANVATAQDIIKQALKYLA
ncbi:MAG: Holliday junction branch migration protein RuvA [Lachnospiraceae bacterium]|jgi:Holliday junction DNA helicase RuvA|nr:Holliday junction branch migration protein RuvA [Lachnospiraceae bacterium]